jgi:Ser/Thr protein kinase RdoA (MazF antagonist)
MLVVDKKSHRLSVFNAVENMTLTSDLVHHLHFAGQELGELREAARQIAPATRSDLYRRNEKCRIS